MKIWPCMVTLTSDQLTPKIIGVIYSTAATILCRLQNVTQVKLNLLSRNSFKFKVIMTLTFSMLTPKTI